MSTVLALAQCPWCGAVPDATRDLRFSAIQCPGCGVSGPSGSDADEAVDAWQKRAPGHGPRKPLAADAVRRVVADAGYDRGVSHAQRASFINGLRHGEAVHGIKQ